MVRIVLLSLFLLSYSSFGRDIFDEMDRIFEEQSQVMEKLMKKGFGQMNLSFQGSQSDIQISSEIEKINGKTYEVVSIEVSSGSISSLQVNKAIKIQSEVTKTEKTTHGSFSSTSQSSSTYPIPRGGIYKPSMDKQEKGKRKLYFEVSPHKIAETWGQERFRGFSSFGNQILNNLEEESSNLEVEEEEKGVILPQRKI